jgi:hypothetical protein
MVAVPGLAIVTELGVPPNPESVLYSTLYELIAEPPFEAGAATTTEAVVPTALTDVIDGAA